MATIKRIRKLVAGIPSTTDISASGTVFQAWDFQIANTGVTASKPLKLDSNKILVSGDINLASEVTGQLPYANMSIADGDLTIAKTAGLQTALDGKIASSEKGAANGVCPLGADQKVSASYLPSYVDDVIEVADYASLPGTGETGKIYVTLDNNKVYRWSGSVYVEIAPSPGSTDFVAEGSVNLYFTEARVRATVLTGIATDAGGNVTASDSVLMALGKLEYRTALNDSKVGYTAAQAEADLLVSTVNGTELHKAPTDTAVATYVTGLLSGKADSVHSHAISDVTGLQTALDGKAASSHTHTASEITDFTSAARTAAVVNSTAGSETDQAASVAAMKSYVAGAVPAGAPKIQIPGTAGEAFDANKTYCVRYGISGETAGRVYKASKLVPADKKFWGIGVIQPTSALSAGDSITITVIGELNLLSGDTNMGASSEGLPLFLHDAGVITEVTPESGLAADTEYASLVIGQVKSRNATVTNTVISVLPRQLMGVDVA